MRTFCIACLALAVWIFVIFSYFNPEKSASSPAETPIPEGAVSVPTFVPAATPTPPIRQGPLVIYCGKVVQVSGADVMIRCQQTMALVRGHYALETVWHGTEGQSEIGGDFLLSGDPLTRTYQPTTKVFGVAELGAPTAYTTSAGWYTRARKLTWVAASTVANYKPAGMPVSFAITPPPSGNFIRDSLGLKGSALDK